VALEPDEVAERAGAATHLGGVFEPTAASIQPALLARGLRRAALARGVQVFEGTPMLGLTRSTPPRVRTPGGTIAADRVVLALNAWAAQLRELRRRLVVIASDMVATAPAPERIGELGWGGLCLSDSRMLVNYFRATRDGRVAWGKAGGTLAFAGRVGRSFQGASPRAAAVAASMRRLYPQLADLEVESSWTGPIDRSTSGLPFFARLGERPDLLVGAGYSGNGVGPSLLGGRILAALALGLDDEWATSGLVGLPPGGFPPEPARYVGGRVVRAAVERKEAAEDAGRPPRRRDCALSGLAPAGLVPTNADD
jgi:glycine/D-amino acid oxidase-like deaminating enzyme